MGITAPEDDGNMDDELNLPPIVNRPGRQPMNMGNVKGPSHLINRDTATSEGIRSPAIEEDN